MLGGGVLLSFLLLDLRRLLWFSHFLLRFPHLFLELSVDNFPSRGVTDVLLLIHQLSLDLQCKRAVLDDLPNDVVGGFGGVVMTSHLCTQVENQFERFTRQLVLAS